MPIPRIRLHIRDLWSVQKCSSSKAIVSFVRGVHWQYASAHDAKSAKSGSPKVREAGDLPARSRSGEGWERRWRIFSTDPK